MCHSCLIYLGPFRTFYKNTFFGDLIRNNDSTFLLGVYIQVVQLGRSSSKTAIPH